MDIKELTERYQDRFDAHYMQDDNGTGRKGRKRKKEVETPNFLKDVIRPILDTLPDLLPEYGFTKTTDDYAMYGEYYRIKAGIVLVGGFSIGRPLASFRSKRTAVCGRRMENDLSRNNVLLSV